MSPHRALLKAGAEEVNVRSWRWLVTVLSSSAVYAAVATVTRFRFLEALSGDGERDCENLDSSDTQANNMLK